MEATSSALWTGRLSCEVAAEEVCEETGAAQGETMSEDRLLMLLCDRRGGDRCATGATAAGDNESNNGWLLGIDEEPDPELEEAGSARVDGI